MSTDKQRESSEGADKRLSNLKPFKPGQSGNPAGRPKSITLSEAIRLQLAKKVSEGSDYTYAEAIAQVLCVAAVKGNVNAAREIADRTEGKPKQVLDLDMRVNDWRTLASQHGLSEQDVIREARLLINESATDSGDA
ncbi:MAG: DUF5681 domain-containing protein [Pyrinomonadaceae bacterium]